MQKLTDYLEKIQLWLGTLLLVIFVITTLLQVGTRYLGISATWTEEISVNAFIWSMLLGAAVMAKRKQHFSFTLLNGQFSPQKKPILLIVQDVIIIVFCAFCFVYSAEITSTFWNSRWISIPSLKQGYVWLILPITFISIVIYLVEDVIKQITALKNGTPLSDDTDDTLGEKS
ncbi:TRAP-type C4-dicarboxylate transport system, small permease component [Pasteurella testudinis DSM 23072]|uniref:TRAP transporter small permease protein n=1 Tax=Pasteurella testudinis DSM 23072 TaxID=1122938 RepID=A0A1W1UEK2_9PAST|nr:TRAP transporter small permease [Pasteurella testudinis]SMB79479.1 TRAP-type C4-dicarboxylate transport system, small permease component [Pasteurella testudinis DSM 23072]SUB50754.1 Trap-type c4-dicarboxylate transport system, small permease component [Pasteurella testudinis]